MAGIHADRGDKSHRIVSGEVPVVGMEVLTNNLDKATILEVSTDGECGYYCEAWHKVSVHTTYTGAPIVPPYVSSFNCDRLTTRRPQ